MASLTEQLRRRGRGRLAAIFAACGGDHGVLLGDPSAAGDGNSPGTPSTPGNIKSVRILGSDDHDGWAAEVTITDWAAAGSLAVVPGTLPLSPKGTFTLTSRGYTGTVLGTIERTLWVKCPVYKVFPDFTIIDAVASGADLKVKVCLDNWVYEEDADILFSALAGLFTSDLGSSNAVAGLPVTNESGKAYHPVNGHWVSEQRRCANGTTRVEFFAVHGHAMNTKMLAAWRVEATGQTSGATASATVTDMSASPVDGWPCYGADLDLSTGNGFTLGEAVFIQSKCYPWVGNAAAVLDTTGVASTKDVGTLVWAVMNRTIAVVDPGGGNDTTGAAGNQATADGAPCATFGGAVRKIKAFNLATYGLNVADGGEVQLKAGNYTQGVGSGAFAAASGDTVNGSLTIRPHSSTNRAGVIFTGWDNSNFPGSAYSLNWQRMQDVTLTLGGGNLMFQGAGAVCVMDHVDATTSHNLSGGDGVVEFINGCSAQAGTCSPANSSTWVRLNRGTTWNGVNAPGGKIARGNRMLFGCSATNCIADFWDNGVLDTTVRPIMAYCRNENHQGGLFFPGTDIAGGGRVCVLHELVGPSAALEEIGGADLDNYIDFFGTYVGDRINRQGGWNSTPAIDNTIEVFMRGVAANWLAYKHDEYSTGFPTLRKSWPWKYGIGCYYNLSEHDWAGTGSDQFAPVDMGVGSMRNVDPGFTDDQSRYGGGAGGGDYTPASGAVAIAAKIPLAYAAVPFDIEGTAVPTPGSVGAVQL